MKSRWKNNPTDRFMLWRRGRDYSGLRPSPFGPPPLRDDVLRRGFAAPGRTHKWLRPHTRSPITKNNPADRLVLWRRGRDYSGLSPSPCGPPSLRDDVLRRGFAAPGRTLKRLRPHAHSQNTKTILRIVMVFWRRGRDSNPRYGLTYTHFPGVRLQPLGHLSHSKTTKNVPTRPWQYD